MISLRQLRYFQAVAQHEHFGRAAEACAVSQPALSMQIQELEKELKVVLIERRRSGVQLTEEGREVARRAERILADLRDLTDYARHRAGTLTGPLHLGVIPSVAPYLLPPLLPLIRSEFPGLELHLRETLTQALVSELVEGKLDLLLLALPVDRPEIETTVLFEDPFLLAVPASRRIKGRVRATAELLAKDRLLLLEEGHCLRDQALDFCNLRQVENLDTFGASSLSTIVQMVANGFGVTLLPRLSVELETRSSAIQVVRFADPEPSRQIGLAWRTTSPRKRDFVELGRLICRARPGAKSAGARS
jgi:LysR family transcriptional regulator, hydrogen peroxide-inducible genes activator